MTKQKLRLEAAWRQKSLENLEKSVWTNPDSDSSIVRRAMLLRKIPVGDLTADDMRFLLVQQMGCPYTLELAMEQLRADLFMEAGYYPGDLLHAMLAAQAAFRETFPQYFQELAAIALPRIDELRAIRPRLDLTALFPDNAVK